MTNTRWFNTDYVEEKCEEFVLLSEHKPEKAVRKIWPLLVWFLMGWSAAFTKPALGVSGERRRRPMELHTIGNRSLQDSLSSGWA